MAESDSRKPAEQTNLQNGEEVASPVAANGDQGKAPRDGENSLTGNEVTPAAKVETAVDAVAAISEVAAKQTLIERLGLVAPKGKPDPYAHRRGEPRSFIALWIMYVVAAIFLTLATLGVRGFVQVDVYRAGLLRLMLALMAGVVLVWPMVRLSQRGPMRPVLSFLVDGFIVLLPVLGVVLPQTLPWMEVWGAQAAMCCVLWCSAWGLVVAGVLVHVFARSDYPTHAARMAGAGLLALVCLVPVLFLPFVSTRSAGAGQELFFTGWLLPSPLGGLFDIIRDRSWSGSAVRVAPEHWKAGWMVLGVGAVTLATGAMRSLGRPKQSAEDTQS